MESYWPACRDIRYPPAKLVAVIGGASMDKTYEAVKSTFHKIAATAG